MLHLGLAATVIAEATTGATGTVVGAVIAGVVGVVVMVVVVIVVVVPVVVAVIVVEGVASPVGRAPAPVVVVTVAITIVVGVVAIAVAIIVGVVPATKHIGDVARLYPHLVAHNHNGVEGGVVGQSEEVGIAIAEVVVGRGEAVTHRGEAPQTTCIGAAVIIHIDVVVDADVVATAIAIGCHISTTKLNIGKDVVDVGYGIRSGHHCGNTFLLLGFGLGVGCGNFLFGFGQSHHVVSSVEVVDVGGRVATESNVE